MPSKGVSETAMWYLVQDVCSLCQSRHADVRLCERTDCIVLEALSMRDSLIAEIHDKCHPKVRRAIALLTERAGRPLRVSDLAREIGLSGRQLQRLFKQEIGTSISTYLKTHRLHKSCRLLILTDLDVSEICYAVGWSDRTNFHHVFKKTFGMSPLRFRESRPIKVLSEMIGDK